MEDDQLKIQGASILSEIKKAQSILLHCHPSPDPDSLGSVLAMKLALESLGKKVTAIKGDSDIPQAFMHFPGAEKIIKKYFGEINVKDFDLFIILDSGSPEMISKLQIPTFPLSIKTLIIDHHASNKGYADINLIDLSSPATAFTLFKLFKKWGIEITPSIAINLFMGIYTDTGGFRYAPTDYKVFEAASELTKIAPDYAQAISTMNNSKKKESLIYEGLALACIQTFFGEKLALTAVSYEAIVKNNISAEDVSATFIPNQLISVSDFCIGGSLSERELGKVSCSFRSKDDMKYDVSKLAVALGGGGHKKAAGATLNMPLDQAISKVVETAKTLYNL